MSNGNAGFLFGFLFAAILAVVAVVMTVNVMNNFHREAVFNELIMKHACKPIRIFKDGEPISKGTCVLPDSTIIQMQ